MSDAAGNKKWMNVDEVAGYIGIKKSTVYQYVSEDRIPHYKVPGSQLLRFKTVELDDWMESGKVKTQEEYLEQMAKERDG